MHYTRILSRLSVGFLAVLFTTACEDSTTEPNNRTQVQFVNAIPGGNNLRLSFNTVLIGAPLNYRQFGGCKDINHGTYSIELSQTGGTAPLVTLPTKTFDETKKYTIIASGTLAEPHLTVLLDEFPRPARGRTKVRPFNALPTGDNLDLYITRDGEDRGAANASNLAFNASSPFIDAAAVRSKLEFTRTGRQTVVASDGPVNLIDRGARTLIIAGNSDIRTFVVLMCN